MIGPFDKRLHAHAVDELHGAAGPGRKTNAEDGADIGLSHSGEHVFTQTACRFHGLPVQQAVFQIGDVPAGVRFFKQRFEFWPEELLGALRGRVLVEAGATGAARPLVLFHHVGHQQLAGAGDVSLALGLEVGTGLFHHMQAQTQGGLVQHRQRPDRHAALDSGVFYDCGWNALAQHGRTLHHKSAKHAAGKEAACIVHHDRDLAYGLYIVKSAGHRFVTGLFAANDLHQFHFVHRTEEMDADEFFGRGAGRGQATDGQGGGVGSKEAARGEQGLGLVRDTGLELAVLEHGLDDQVTTLQIVHLVGGLDAIEHLHLIECRHAALVNARLCQSGAVGFAGVGLLRRHVFEYGRDALAGLRERNARAHHAGTQHTHHGGFEAGDIGGARLAALDGVYVEEEGVDHGAGVAAGHELGEVTALDPQGGRQVHLQPLHHTGQDRFRGRVQAAGPLFDHGRCHHQHVGQRRVGRQAAGHLVALGFPGVLGIGVGDNPGQRPRAHLGRGVV